MGVAAQRPSPEILQTMTRLPMIETFSLTLKIFHSEASMNESILSGGGKGVLAVLRACNLNRLGVCTVDSEILGSCVCGGSKIAKIQTIQKIQKMLD